MRHCDTVCDHVSACAHAYVLLCACVSVSVFAYAPHFELTAVETVPERRLVMLFPSGWRTPWTARRSNQSILKISPGIPLEGMLLKLKLQYFGHLMGRVDSLEKTLVLEGIDGRRTG